MNLGASLTGKQAVVLAVSLLLVVIVAWTDYITGVELGFSVFYLLPIILASAYGTTLAGLIIAVASGVAWYLVDDALAVHPALVHAWNVAAELGVFAATSVSVSIARRYRHGLEHKVEERTTSLRQEIAERKKIEEGLKVTLAELGERSAQLRALTFELTQAEHRERERIAHLLHDDLQQMLVAAKLKLAAAGRVPERESWLREVEAAQDLMGEAIRISRTLAAELCPPELHEGGLVAALRNLGARMAVTHNLDVRVAADIEIPFDRDGICELLYQIVRESLFNTVKHAGVSEASVSVTRASDSEARIVVEDRGSGFDPAILEEKVGFGLASARSRIHLLGGSWEIQSAPGQGTRLALIVPINFRFPAAGTIQPESRLPATPAERTRVAIVDDNANLRLMLVALLQDEAGIQIAGQAENGEEAIKLVQKANPDVVLMDIGMPVMNGIEATKRIISQRPATRVIGLSAYGDTAETEAIKQAGAETCLVKESSVEKLVEAIRGNSSRPPRGRNAG